MSTTTAINPAGIHAIQTLSPILSAIVVGLVIGAIGRMYASRRRGIPAWRSILDAVVGAFGGTAIAHLVGLSNWALLFQVVMATLAVFIVTPAYRRRFARRDHEALTSESWK
ncbi:GlsB/YeaQ/YmgE family stress response membrane protein [Pseudonocardia sp. CA-142604]|uniref:GlsB/YeaQ/YmgE family stress response membrane protein n=1 Tax=Pseudonocardia sp. CA-142604 TaxID=3240024 RepID=UPI003D91A1EC